SGSWGSGAMRTHAPGPVGPAMRREGTQRIEACAPDPPTMVTSRRGTRMDEAAQAGSAVGDGPPPLVIAGDIGGTSSRPVPAPLDGAVIAQAGGPGAHPRRPGAEAFDHVASPAREVPGPGR